MKTYLITPNCLAPGYTAREVSASTKVAGAARIYQGDAAPTQEQMAALFSVPLITVPSEVGSGQIRAALIAKGVASTDDALTTTVEGAITTAIAEPTQQAIALTLWRNGSTFKRAHPFISLVKVVLSKDDAWVDDLFRLAATF